MVIGNIKLKKQYSGATYRNKPEIPITEASQSSQATTKRVKTAHANNDKNKQFPM